MRNANCSCRTDWLRLRHWNLRSAICCNFDWRAVIDITCWLQTRGFCKDGTATHLDFPKWVMQQNLEFDSSMGSSTPEHNTERSSRRTICAAFRCFQAKLALKILSLGKKRYRWGEVHVGCVEGWICSDSVCWLVSLQKCQIWKLFGGIRSILDCQLGRLALRTVMWTWWGSCWKCIKLLRSSSKRIIWWSLRWKPLHSKRDLKCYWEKEIRCCSRKVCGDPLTEGLLYKRASTQINACDTGEIGRVPQKLRILW